MKKNLKKIIGLILINSMFLASSFPIINAFVYNKNNIFYESAPYEYFTYQEMTDLFYEFEKNHSDIMSLNSIGKTYEGRDIWMIKLSDNVDVNEDEPGVLLMGAHHGDEKPSYEVLIFFINYILNKNSMMTPYIYSNRNNSYI